MFERFTSAARRVVVHSQEEAQRLHHNYIGTEHILLGLLGEPEGIAGRVLDGFGMTLGAVRHEVIAMVGEGQAEVTGHIPFTPRAKKILELGLREALQFSHDHIGTEHILLGLIREGDGVAAAIMRKHADLPAIRAAVIDQAPARAGSEGGRRPARLRIRGGPHPGGHGSSAGDLELTATPAADAVLAQAVRLAGAQPVGSHHLLLAGLADPASAAAKALASAGIDLDQAKDALRSADITGSSDEQPEQAGRRQMNIQVTGELVTVVAADPVIVQAGQAALSALAAHGESGQPAALGGVIRGADLHGAAAASLATAWQALRDSLIQITHAPAPAERDNPDKPEPRTT